MVIVAICDKVNRDCSEQPLILRVNEAMTESLGQRIKRLREQKGMSQETLGKRCGTTQQAINRIETGETKMPRKGLLMKLSEELETPTTELLTGLKGLDELDQDTVNLVRILKKLPSDEKETIAKMIELAGKHSGVKLDE